MKEPMRRLSGTDGASSRQQSPRAAAPLAGLRVLDLSRVLAGPLCAQLLADQGAEVIKVEAPTGDETRLLGPPFDADGAAAYFGAVNRGKRSIALDLSQPGGRMLLERLIAKTDIVIENFLPGTMARWGFDYCGVLSQKFPQLIYCQISGFGPDGPLGGLPGYDAVLQAMCGLMSVNGTAQSGPTRVGVPVVDHLTAYTAMVGILTALYERNRTGGGQMVEACLFDTAVGLLVPHAANWMMSGSAPGLLGSAHPNIAPYDKFKVLDGDIFLGVLTDSQFRRLCDCIGLRLAQEDQFATNAMRLAHKDVLRTELERVLAEYRRDELCELLMRSGVPAAPVNTVPEALQHAHARHRRMIVGDRAAARLGSSVRLTRTPPVTLGTVPKLSEHAQEVLSELGFDASAIRQLMDAGVVMSAENREVIHG